MLAQDEALFELVSVLANQYMLNHHRMIFFHLD